MKHKSSIIQLFTGYTSFSMFVLFHAILHGPLIKSTNGSNWQWCHSQLLPDWESRINRINTSKRLVVDRRAF